MQDGSGGAGHDPVGKLRENGRAQLISFSVKCATWCVYPRSGEAKRCSPAGNTLAGSRVIIYVR